MEQDGFSLPLGFGDQAVALPFSQIAYLLRFIFSALHPLRRHLLLFDSGRVFIRKSDIAHQELIHQQPLGRKLLLQGLLQRKFKIASRRAVNLSGCKLRDLGAHKPLDHRAHILLRVTILPVNMQGHDLGRIDTENDGRVNAHFLTVAGTRADRIVAPHLAFVGRRRHGVGLPGDRIDDARFQPRHDQVQPRAQRLRAHAPRREQRNDHGNPGRLDKEDGRAEQANADGQQQRQQHPCRCHAQQRS